MNKKDNNYILKSKREQHNQMNIYQLYLIMVLFAFIGAINLIMYKLLDEIVVGKYDDGKLRYFVHPYFQCAIMFFGEFLCLFIYAIKLAISREELYQL